MSVRHVISVHISYEAVDLRGTDFLVGQVEDLIDIFRFLSCIYAAENRRTIFRLFVSFQVSVFKTHGRRMIYKTLVESGHHVSTFRNDILFALCRFGSFLPNLHHAQDCVIQFLFVYANTRSIQLAHQHECFKLGYLHYGRSRPCTMHCI